MQRNNYRMADDAIKSGQEIATEKLWKYAPIGVMFLSAANKAFVNSNPAYESYKKFYTDWNLPSIIQEIGKATVSAESNYEDIATGAKVWSPENSFKGVYDQMCPIDPSFFDYIYNEIAKLGQMIDSPIAIAGIMTSAAACAIAVLAKMKEHENNVRPLSYYKNKSWESLQKHINKGDDEAFRSAYHELVGGSNGLIISLKKSRAAYRRAENILRNLEFEDLLSFKLIGDLSTIFTGKTYRREQYLRNITSSIVGSSKMEIVALLDELEPAIFNAAAKHGYSFESVIGTYIDLANIEFKKDLSFNIISSKSNAYDDIIKQASEYQGQHLAYHSFANLVAKAYQMQGEVKMGNVGKEALDEYIKEIDYYTSISLKVSCDDGAFDKLEKAARGIKGDLESLSTDYYLELLGRSGDYHTLSASKYSDPQFFYENAITKIIPDGTVARGNTTADYITIAMKNYVSKHLEKQVDNQKNREGIMSHQFDSDEVALDKLNDKKRAFMDNSVSIAVATNVAANIFQAGTSVKDADYISAPINISSVLTEAITFIRSPDVVKENFSKAVDAISKSTLIAIPVIGTVASIIIATAGQYLALKADGDEHFNIERTKSWKDVKKYLSKEDKALNNIFNHQMDNSFRRHFAKARHSELFDSIKRIDAGALAPLAIIAQAYKDTGDEKIFNRYIKNTVTQEEFKSIIVDNTEILISEYAKRTNPKVLLDEIVSTLNQINDVLDPKMIIADTDKFKKDIYTKTERLANVHVHSKAFAGSVSDAFTARLKMNASLLKIDSLEKKLADAESSGGDMQAKILIRGFRQRIEFENKALESQCKKFSEAFTDINTFAHAKKVFGDKEGEYEPLQTIASMVVHCEFDRDYTKLSELIGVDITPEILADKNMLFKEIVVPFSVQRGVGLKHNSTGWDYLGRVVSETIDPFLGRDLSQDMRLKIDKNGKEMRRSTLALKGSEDRIYDNPIFCM
ncbi:hypothetical protein LMH73_011060 [Vibrio splendidus]|nr:hypothetical protein [Vibrio splendidus]MCC4880765.1 hypothetical protein [Vibrio splendidus]